MPKSTFSPGSDYFLIPRDSEPVGYAALCVRHQLATLPHHRWTFLATRGTPRQLDGNRHVLRLQDHSPASMSDVEHATFALKHDGVSLPILVELFRTVNQRSFEAELVRALTLTPTGQYIRRLWFFYEWATARTLAVADCEAGPYVDALDRDDYYTAPGVRQPRHRVVDNLPGTRKFCPLVRRVDALSGRSADAIRAKLDAFVARHDPDLLRRAIAYLYTKETRSSFAIEHEVPSANRAERFAAMLEHAAAIEPDEVALTRLQNRIVEPRFAEEGYRTTQNYVGETVGLHRQVMHFVAPRAKDVRDLMGALFEGLDVPARRVGDAIVEAATLAFGFVFIHPFEDGNGRLHRLLIHHVLARRGVTPGHVIVPVSAVMLAKRTAYDQVLESFSRPVMTLVDWELDDYGTLAVANDTARYYRYFDATPMAVALYAWLDEAIDRELRDEIAFLIGLRAARAAMREVVDLPDRLADLFIKLVAANAGKLAKRQRAKFVQLDDREIASLEKIVREHLPTGRAIATPP